MASPQAGILSELPKSARYLSMRRRQNQDLDPATVWSALDDVINEIDGNDVVLGLGASLIKYLGGEVPGLQSFPNFKGAETNVPVTQQDLWLWVRQSDAGAAMILSTTLCEMLQSAFELVSIAEGHMYADGRDLSGYIDGTENPIGQDALDTALVDDSRVGLLYSSFVVVQRWQHDLNYFAGLTQAHRDNIIGRRLSDNEELDDAPLSAHVKRTAQESFSPEAFLLRRSMPWTQGMQGGLQFVAFARSFRPFEAQMQRMLGLEDDILDGLFQFSAPISGEYYWCPPVRDGYLDLSWIRS